MFWRSSISSLVFLKICVYFLFLFRWLILTRSQIKRNIYLFISLFRSSQLSWRPGYDFLPLQLKCVLIKGSKERERHNASFIAWYWKRRDDFELLFKFSFQYFRIFLLFFHYFTSIRNAISHNICENYFQHPACKNSHRYLISLKVIESFGKDFFTLRYDKSTRHFVIRFDWKQHLSMARKDCSKKPINTKTGNGHRALWTLTGN